MAQHGNRRMSLAMRAAVVLGSAVLLATSTTPVSADGLPSSGRVLVSRGISTPTAGTSDVRHGGLFTGGQEAGEAAGGNGAGPNRSMSTRGGRHVAGTTPLTVDAATPKLGTSFQGLGITDDANTAGFVLEPPDQGLCVGNGRVLELVNVVGQVYTTGGTRSGPTFYLNDFFHEDPNFANASDPGCYYDPDTNRFYVDMLFYDSDRDTGELNGLNRIDLAVSDSGDPGGSYHIYSFDVTADGPSAFNIGDYPQIGADKEGLYITTNSYPFFEDGFGGAQLYALSKRGVAEGTDTRVSHVTLAKGPGGTPFGLRPTTAPASSYATENNGTEYLTSSEAAEEAGNKQGFAQSIGLWALEGTNTLAPAEPRSLSITRDGVTVDRYGVPPLSDQKAGSYPLGQCLSDTQCKRVVFNSSSPAAPHAEGLLDSSDSRMNQSVYSQGRVFATLDTVVNVGGQDRAGLAYYVLRPTYSSGGVLKGNVLSQGRLAVPGNNLTFGAFGVDAAGKATMALNLVGSDYYPSQGYVTFDSSYRPSPVHVSGNGVGPTDGFTEYTDFSDSTDTLRPRWGDYAATAFDPVTGSLWIGNEYIAQNCTVATYQTDPTCGGTRSRYGNWSTRVSEIKP
jgi:hypothetical protein